MLTLSLVLGAILLVFVSYTVLAPLIANYGRFGSGFRLDCPEKNTHATVRVNAPVAAIASAYGARKLAMKSCSLLRPGDVCDEACLRDVVV